MVTLICELDLEGCVLPEYLPVGERERIEAAKASDHRYFTFAHRRYSPQQKISEAKSDEQ